MAKEYIEREAARKYILEEYPLLQRDRLMRTIDDIPAADVRPVTRGEWIDHQEGRWIYAKCSECGTVHDVKSNFCPNCGADMREQEG